MPQNAVRDPNQYRPEIQYLVTPTPPTLTATITATPSYSVITFTGFSSPGLNIWTVAGPNPWADGATLYQTTGDETLEQIASSIAAQVELLGVAGVSATANDTAAWVTGGTPVWCNIGQAITTTPIGDPIAVLDIGRFDQTVLITVWAPVPDEYAENSTGNREQLENAILLSIGGNDNRWVIAPDASGFSALWGNTGRWSDKPEDTYTVFRSDLELELQYSLYRPVTVTPVGVIDVTLHLNANAPQVEYVGGPVTPGDPNV